MSDDKTTTTTTTMWQDNHSGLRRHKLMTKELGETIPALYANEKVENTDDVMARAKLFCPYNGWRWYVTEWDARTGDLLRPRSRASRRSGATSSSPSWRRRPCSAAFPPSSATCTGEPKTLGEIRKASSGMAA